jgi:hypothetical protein
MPRIPVRILTSQPQGSTNPSVVTGRANAPMSARQLGPAQPRLQMQDFAGNRAQSAARQATQQSTARFDADQIVIPGVAFLPEVPTIIVHRLGRAFVGAYVVNVAPTIAGSLPYSLGFVVIPNLDARLNASRVQIQSLTLCTGDVVVY